MTLRPRAHLTVALSLIAVVACSDAKDDNDDDKKIDTTPVATDVGSPSGATSALSIGPAGGSLPSSDGRVTLIVPAGALATDTNISITPISNKAHGGIGVAYRMEPDGQTFASPVSLRFSFVDGELLGGSAEGLGVAFQNADGFWSWLDAPAVDASARTVTVASTHFTDFSMVHGFRLLPLSATVKVSDSKALRLVACYPAILDDSNGDALAPLGLDCGESSDSLAPPVFVSEWAVNGTVGGSSSVGTVVGDVATAIYDAPASKPSSNPVAVSARITTKKGAVVLVVSNITIVDDTPGYTGDVTFSVGTAFTGGTATVNFERAKVFQFSTAYRGRGTISATFTTSDCEPVAVTAPLVVDSDPDGFDDGTFIEVFNTDAPVFPSSFTFNLKGEPQTKTFTCGLNTAEPFSVTQDIAIIVPVTFCDGGYPTYQGDGQTIAGTQNCSQIASQVTYNFTRQ